MSAMCQKQTFVLFDHIVGLSQKRGWHSDAKRFCCR